MEKECQLLNLIALRLPTSHIIHRLSLLQLSATQRTAKRELTFPSGCVQGWTIPFISRYKLSNSSPLGLGPEVSTGFPREEERGRSQRSFPSGRFRTVQQRENGEMVHYSALGRSVALCLSPRPLQLEREASWRHLVSAPFCCCSPLLYRTSEKTHNLLHLAICSGNTDRLVLNHLESNPA